MKTLRKEFVSIKVNKNKDLIDVIKSFLKRIGFKFSKGYRPIQESEYIWVNFKNTRVDWIGEIVISDNNSHTPYKTFDAATQLGEIIEFFTQEPEPPANIKPFDGITVWKDGSINFSKDLLTRSEFDMLVASRNELLMQWEEYNKKQTK